MHRAAIAVVLIGCGGTASKPAAAPTHVSADDAESGALDALGEAHESLAAGNAQGVMPVLGTPFTLIGPGADQVFTDKTAAVVALGDAWHNDAKHKLKAKDPEVHVAPGGHAAWAIDQGTLDGSAYVATIVLTGSDEIWSIDAAQLAKPVKKNPGGAPGALPAEVGAGAKEVVDLFDQAMQGRSAAEGQLDDGAVLIEGNGKIVAGAEKIAKLWAPPEPKKKKHKKKKHHHAEEAEAPPPEEPPPPTTTFAAKGEPRGGVTADGTIAWICADIDVTEPGDTAVPHRFFYVYEKGDDGWRLVALHEATFPSPL